MNIRELMIVAMASIKSSKLRSFLTTLGIVIGIAAVISVVAIGQGGKAMLMQELDSIGTDQTRTVQDAVQAVRARLQTPPRQDYWWYWERLRYIGDDTTPLDLNKRPF